jgi:hypothetical protein
MPKSTKKVKYKLGAIVAVPLPGGRFAYAKVYRDFDLGVYDFVSNEIVPIAEVLKHKIAFFQAATDEPIKSGEWPIIGDEAFPDEESAWGPPRAVVFPPGAPLESADLKISHKDVLRRATAAEVKGLDFGTFAQESELLVRILVDRLIHGKHDEYRVKP